MPATGYVLLPDRGVLALHGGDVRLSPGSDQQRCGPRPDDRAAYGALLTLQGKFLFDFFIAQDVGQLLETEAARLGELHRRFSYRLRSKVDIEDCSARFAVAALRLATTRPALDLPELPGAARTLEQGVVFVDPRLPRLGAAPCQGHGKRDARSTRLPGGRARGV